MSRYIEKNVKSAVENLPISRKLLGIVMLPTVLGLAFGIILFCLLIQAEREAQAEYHGRAILAVAAAAQKSIIASGVAMVAMITSKSDAMLSTYRQKKEDAKRCSAELLELTAGYPDEHKHAKRLERLVIDLFKKGDEACDLSLKGAVRFAPLRMVQVRMDLESAIQEILSASNDLRKATEQYIRKEDLSKNYRQWAKILLLAGMGGSIVLSLLAAEFLSRSFVSRIDQIIDTTTRFSEGQPAPPPISGRDELAQVDSFIHKMVDSLNESHHREQTMIRENQLRLQHILDSLPVGVLITDEAGELEFTNQALKAIGGQRTEGDETSLGSIAKEVLAAKEAGRTKWTLARRDGSESTFEITFTETAIGAAAKILSVLNDVSQKESLDRMKRDLVAMVSHDLRSPLTSLRCTLSMIEEGAFGSLSERGLKAIQRSDSELIRLIRMINSLLDYEKMESGQLVLDRQPISVDKLIDQSLEAVAPLAHDAGVRLAQSSCGEPVLVDADKITQVILNLLTNAIKFSPPNSAITIRSTLQQERVTVSVTDTGRGISPEHQSTIFEKFKQVTSEDATVRGGSGLGLHICKVMVEKHGGEIGVTSQEGHGSTFWFTVPRASAVTPAVPGSSGREG